MIGKIISIIFLIAALSISSYLLYSVYQDYCSPMQNLNINYTQLENQPSYSNSSLQFFPNMRFNHSNLLYKIDSSCSSERIIKIKEAFSILESKAEVISFYESDNPDITLDCSEKNIEEEKNNFIAGSGGAEGSIPYTGLFYIIPKVNVTLYKEVNCRLPLVEIHEILHVLGFNHSKSDTSIMYPIVSCNQAITYDIISEIKRLYLIPALPDLYFADVSGTKQGSRVNLNFSVRNQGLIDSGNASAVLYSGNSKIDAFELGIISPGSGRIYTIKNEKVSSDSLKLEIQDGEELDKNNNIAELSLS